MGALSAAPYALSRRRSCRSIQNWRNSLQRNARPRRKRSRTPDTIRDSVTGNTTDSDSVIRGSNPCPGAGTTVEQLLEWFQEGEWHGNDWMLIVGDQHTGREFPVYVSPNKSLAYIKRLWSGKTHKILAMYDLSRSFSDQSDSFRTIVMTQCLKNSSM